MIYSLKTRKGIQSVHNNFFKYIFKKSNTLIFYSRYITKEFPGNCYKNEKVFRTKFSMVIIKGDS